jgi:oxalate---CoA ligase
MDELLRLAHWAECKPDEPALLAPGRRTLTYGALWPLLRQARSAFRDAGIRPEEAVAVLQPGLDSVLACLAISDGSAFVPLDPSLTFDEYRRYLKRLGVSTLVIQDRGESQASAAARELGLCVLRARLLSDGAGDRLAVETVLPRTSGGTERRTDAVALLLTSSTTADPKFVPVSAGNLTARCTSNGHALGVGPTDRCLAMMPFFHMHGIHTVLTQLLYGGSVVWTPGFDPLRFAWWWKQFRPTWFSATVPMLHAIAASSPADREILASAPPRFIFVSGASPELGVREAVERIMRAAVLVGYGLTECGPATRNRLGAARAGSVGTSSGLEIAIADPLGNILPSHHEGEVLLRGPAVISQYLDDADANRQGFRNGWFRTGDLGRLDDDGFLFLSGRLKEIINRGSEKILPVEVDRALANHPDVQDAASFAIPHRTLGEDVAAAVVLRDGAQLTETDLRRYAATQLAAFKIPRLVVFLDSIPRTAAGKPKRALLASQYGTPEPRKMVAEAPPTDVEQRIIGIWRGILRDRRSLSIHDDFMRLGGDSLSAACMLAAVDHEFQTNGGVLARSDFFDQPTVRELARIVLECRATSESGEPMPQEILAFRPPGARRESDAEPLFCFPGWRGRDGGTATPYYLRHLAKSLGERQPVYVVTASVPTSGEHFRPVEELAGDSIEAMRRVRPQGPYVLAGHCLGAVVAFEAARQLVAEGETVPRLLLFDAAAPGYPKMDANWSKYGAELSRMIRHLDWRESWSHAYSLTRLLSQRVSGRFRRRIARLDAGRSVNAKMRGGGVGFALWQYIPEGCAVRIIHFIAAEHPVSRVLDDPRYGWRDFARAGIEFQRVPGDHDSMFSAQNAPELAKRIDAYRTTLALVASSGGK